MQDEKTKAEWAWMLPGCSGPCAHGLFDSKEAALKDAADYLDPDEKVIVGIVEWPDPTEYISVDVDELLEAADECAADNGYYVDDELFSAKDGAQKALDDLIRKWAGEYISRGNYWTLHESDPISVNINRFVKPSLG